MLHPKYYYDPTFVETEFDKVFLGSWFFLGLKSEVSGESAFKKVEIFSKSFILQHNAGVYRCFKNVCPHRGAKIAECDYGSGKLKCPYHGWIFNAEGAPAIPERFLFAEEDVQGVKLESLRVETCGNFIFATGTSQKNLRDYLGERYSYLEEISTQMVEVIDRNPMVIEANWKVVVENTLEGYHVKAIHPETLNPQLANDWSLDIGDDPHSTTNEKFNDKTKEHLARTQKLMFGAGDFSQYRHDLIFPNMTVAVTGREIIFVQEIFPVSEQQTLFISHGFNAKFKSTITSAVKDAYKKSSKDFHRKVFDEDKGICKSVQKGLSQQVLSKFLINKKELRVAHFQKCVKQLAGL